MYTEKKIQKYEFKIMRANVLGQFKKLDIFGQFSNYFTVVEY